MELIVFYFKLFAFLTIVILTPILLFIIYKLFKLCKKYYMRKKLLKSQKKTDNMGFLLLSFTSFDFIYSIQSNIIYLTLVTLITIVPLLITIAFFTLAERKVIAAVQRRRGPNVIGLIGLLQPFADGFKLLIKEIILPTKANILIFLFAPIITLTLSFISWSVISFSYYDIISDLNLSLLVLFAISSFSIYGIILAGWSSNSRYPFLGALRSASQIISYEVSLTIIFLIVVYLSNSFNLIDIIYVQQITLWFIIPLLPLFIIFIISILAETNRAPFDLPEAEAEIVAGYNLEYSSIIFAIFFLGEYSNIIIISTLTIILFFGGWDIPNFFFYYLNTTTEFNIIFFEIINYLSYLSNEFWFCFKIICICFFFILIRATFPRLRYDQLIRLGWKIFLPFVCSFFFYCVICKITFGNHAYIIQLPIFF